MSNPNRADTTPLTRAQMMLRRVVPDATWQLEKGGKLAEAQSSRSVQHFQRMLAQGGCASLLLAKTVVVPAEMTLEKGWGEVKSGGFLASARREPAHGRMRTAVAKWAAEELVSQLPEVSPTRWDAISREKVVQRAGTHICFSGGTQATLGRLQKYLPHGRVTYEVVTSEEAKVALSECGLMNDGLRASSIGAVAAEQAIRVNEEASNGLPVMGKFKDDAARDMVLGLVQVVDSELNAVGPAGVEQWLRTNEDSRPWMVALLGKAKLDVYDKAKVNRAEMRFYNVLPRQVALVMQRATQPFEDAVRGIFDDARLHNFGKGSLAHGGAQVLVDRLQEQLDQDGFAYVHCGDDSFIVMRCKDGAGRDVLVMFALDCSSFDLTQAGEVVAAIHDAIAARLERIDPISAALWRAYMRSRIVVTASTLVRRWNDGGPSGMPLQSKVNDVLMHVFIKRLQSSIQGWVDGEPPDEHEMQAVIDLTAEGLGLKVRLEQFSVVRVGRLQEALGERPFLFVGFYLYNECGRIQVFCDLPRTVTNMLYPNTPWIDGRQELAARETARVGSILLSCGVPPKHVKGAFDALCGKVATRLERIALADDVVQQAIVRNPFGAEVDKSMAGLARALRRPPEITWDMPRGAEERTVPPALVLPRKLRVQPARQRTDSCFVEHGATRFNDGRPPPTTFWGPDRAPMERGGVARRIARNLEAEELAWSDESYDDVGDDDDDVYEWE